MFTDSWIYRGFMRFDLWTKQHGGQGIDRRKMHSFEFGHLRGDYLGLNIVLRSFVMQRWISMKDHTTLCLHAEFGATHAKPPLSLISHWNKEHYVDFWQPPDISRSHLYRGTFPWTPTTAIYRAYTVLGKMLFILKQGLESYTVIIPPPPPYSKVVGGGILVSLSPSRIPCPLCSTYSSGWIHFIFIHLIKQLQKVCACKVDCKISKFEFLAFFLNL